MWALISRRFRRWLLFAVGAPVLARALGTIGERLEQRRGPSTASRSLQRGGSWLHRHERRLVPGRRRARR